jgi:general secretion pathway protein J
MTDILAVEVDAVGDEAGFSLIELLVTLVLMSLIAVILTSSLMSSRRALETIQARASEASIEVVQAYLRHTLADLRLVRRPGQPVYAPMIDAQGDRLTVITGYTPRGQYGGLYEIELAMREAGIQGLFELIERRTVFRPSLEASQSAPARAATETRLVVGANSIAIQYFGAQERTAERSWSKTWISVDRLPEMIAIDIVFPGVSGFRWPRLIISVPTGQ